MLHIIWERCFSIKVSIYEARVENVESIEESRQNRDSETLIPISASVLALVKGGGLSRDWRIL